MLFFTIPERSKHMNPESSNKNHAIPQTSCIRCGTCCKKGGPSLHLEDKTLVENGKIPAKYLFTIRKHELSYDNIKEVIIPAESDIIKIKAQKGKHTCMFFDDSISGCNIYENRPKECRVLKCWDTKEISQIYATNRLTRRDLVSNIKGLWELIEDHQDRCSYQTIKKLAHTAQRTTNNKEAIESLLEMIKYDANMRPLIIKKGGMDAKMLKFLFGRPLMDTIKMFGFRISKGKDRLELLQVNAQSFK